MSKLNLLIVIPIGISSPGTPVQKYLDVCIDSLKNQKTKYSYKVVFAADNNLPNNIQNSIYNSGFDVNLYEPYHFMRRGSIWKKIYNEWVRYESKYLAFCHYDDVWGSNKIESQLSLMEQQNLELSWSKVQVIDNRGNIISDDLSKFEKLNKDSINIGSYAFCHSSILKADSWLSNGILDKVEKAAAIYEHLQFVYSHKLIGAKDNNSVFYHRTHSDSVTNQFNSEKQFMKEQRELVNYSLEQVIKDAEELNVKHIIEEITNSLQ
jgi:hypothetical protein